MIENFLYYLWQHKKFDLLNLKTTEGQDVEVLNSGLLNTDAGPDFFNAQIKISEQLWAGNVEIHVNASDWFKHKHDSDKAYDNVILHVVWVNDVLVYRKDESLIPTLVLQDYCNPKTLNTYYNLFSTPKQWINCQNDIKTIDEFVITNWLERLFFDRLERKSEDILKLLQRSKNNWEALLFSSLAKSFGSKVNGAPFMSIANSIDFSIIQKLQNSSLSLEALFFGQSMLLNSSFEDAYFSKLQSEYKFLRQKFNLNNLGVLPLKFLRLRPANFPTIRLSQLASIYSKHKNLFSLIIETTELDEFYKLFRVSPSSYWDTHYTFGKSSRYSNKIVSKSFIDVLVINAIVPIKFSYAKFTGNDINEELLVLISRMKSEKNSIVNKFNELRPFENSAIASQALIQLKNNFCDKNKCLQCAVGNALLSSN